MASAEVQDVQALTPQEQLEEAIARACDGHDIATIAAALNNLIGREGRFGSAHYLTTWLMHRDEPCTCPACKDRKGE